MKSNICERNYENCVNLLILAEARNLFIRLPILISIEDFGEIMSDALKYNSSSPDATSVAAHIARYYRTKKNVQGDELVKIFQESVVVGNKVLTNNKTLSLQAAMNLVERERTGRALARYVSRRVNVGPTSKDLVDFISNAVKGARSTIGEMSFKSELLQNAGLELFNQYPEKQDFEGSYLLEYIIDAAKLGNDFDTVLFTHIYRKRAAVAGVTVDEVMLGKLLNEAYSKCADSFSKSATESLKSGDAAKSELYLSIAEKCARSLVDEIATTSLDVRSVDNSDQVSVARQRYTSNN